jgi:hypothetical protein
MRLTRCAESRISTSNIVSQEPELHVSDFSNDLGAVDYRSALSAPVVRRAGVTTSTWQRRSLVTTSPIPAYSPMRHWML